MQLGLNVVQATQVRDQEKVKELAIPNPVELVNHLDKYVIGQEQAKMTMAVAVVNHYKRLSSQAAKNEGPFGEVELSKSNILMIGPRVAARR